MEMRAHHGLVYGLVVPIRRFVSLSLVASLTVSASLQAAKRKVIIDQDVDRLNQMVFDFLTRQGPGR